MKEEIHLKVYKTEGTVGGKSVWATAIFNEQGDVLIDGRKALVYLLGETTPGESAKAALNSYRAVDNQL